MVERLGKKGAVAKMIKCLALLLLLVLTAVPNAGQRAHENLIKAGLNDDPRTTAVPAVTPSPAAPATNEPAASNAPAPCDGVTFTRSLKYGENSRNVLDVATAQSSGMRRPVVVFVAGDSFAGDGSKTAPNPLVDQAMCFAAQNGLVAFSVSYRLAPASPWPAGSKDVAAAISWIHENADLFGGDKQEIIPIGYATGAFHLASFLAHPEFQERDSYVAGAVLVSGVYRPTPDAGDGEKAYFGTDESKYDSQSALPGLAALDVPLVVAWSRVDAPRFVTQGEKLKDTLCGAGHCPRFALLTKRGSPASVFDLDGAGSDLHERLRQLIGQIDARGLP
jgi:acetyl esterase/lipase